MKTYLQFAGLVVLASVIACGDDSSGGGGSGAAGGAGGDGGAGAAGAMGGGGMGAGGSGAGGMGAGGTGGGPDIPPPPEPLAQIDRMGRPAINTALTDTFIVGDDTTGELDAVSTDPVRIAAEDAYNADGMESGWVMASQGTFSANLAVLDALDTGAGAGLGCGNQPGYTDGATTIASYGLVAGVLANDRLWVDTEGVGCSAAAAPFGSGYLAVEFNALGVMNMGCGGRRPIDDSIDVTYGVVAGIPGMFGDNVNAPASNPGEVFPYLAAPH